MKGNAALIKCLKQQLVSAELVITLGANEGNMELVEQYNKLRAELEAELKELENE